MKASIPTLIRILALLLLADRVIAQELTLFEPIDAQGAEERQGPLQPGAVNPNGQPAYTLRSSTRVGDSYTVELLDRQGKAVKVMWKPGTKAPIPGAGGYAIDSIQQRTVILSQPGSDTCVAVTAKGVSCIDTSHARLTLAIAPPVSPAAQGGQLQVKPGVAVPNPAAAQNPFEAAVQAQQAQAAAQGQAQGAFVNPFTGRAQPDQATQEARQRARAERLNRQDPARIPDNQIPAGMRRVTTPFGDRLVPAQ